MSDQNTLTFRVPSRSLSRIYAAVFNSEDSLEVDRDMSFNSVEGGGVNISKVVVDITGRDFDEVVEITYRNGRFKRATIEYPDGTHVEQTLTGALMRIANPAGSDNQ